MDVREQLEQAMAAIEAQRGTLGDAAVNAALAAFREKLARLPVLPEGARLLESCQVTVLDAEVLGFAGLAAADLADEAREIADDLGRRLDAIITRNGGKMIGHGWQAWQADQAQLAEHSHDRILAVFGMQTAHPDDPERAVRAALEMLDETRRYVSMFTPGKVHLRAGLNSGPLLLANGEPEAASAGLEDTIRLAGRLLSAAEPGEVLISAQTFRAVRGIFDIQTLEPLQAGDAGAVGVYRVRGVRPRGFRLVAGLPGGPGMAASLVGREPEVNRLQAAFQAAIAQRGVRAVILCGEAGVGKSRLVHEFISRLDNGRQPFILLRGRGDWQLNRLPYALLRELLAFRFKILDGDLPAVAREKLLHGVENWLGADGEEAAHWIGHLVGWDFHQSPYLSGRLDDPRRARQLAFAALNRFIAAIAQQTPLVILVDDLQWADDCSLEWLDSLAHYPPGGPVLLVGLARPVLFERQPKWSEGWTGLTRLNLAPLPDDLATMLANQLIRSVITPPLILKASHDAPTVRRTPGYPRMEDPLDSVIAGPARVIVERSGGNPFFLEELVQAFLEDGVFVPSAGEGGAATWRVDASRLAEDHFPGSLREVLQRRLAELPAGEREVILRAAVVGPVFWESAVRNLIESAASTMEGLNEKESTLLHALDLAGALCSLQERGLIYKQDTSAFEHTDEYIFRNALIYEVAYECLPVTWRAHDHARVAAWLSAQSGERVEAYAGVIAGHYERAGERLQAAEWYNLAALEAQRSSAPESTLRFFKRGLDLLPVGPEYFGQRVQLYKGIWDVQWWQTCYTQALETSQALLAEAEACGELLVQAAAWNRIAAVQNRQGEYQAALRSVQRAERFARTGGAARELVLALFNRGVTLYRLGDSAAALEAGQRALVFNQTLFGQAGASGQDEEAYLARGSAPTLELPGGEQNTRQEQAQRMELVRESARVDHPLENAEAARESARILNLLAMINQRAGRFSQAEEDYRQVLALQRERGDLPAVMTVLNDLGVTARMQGNYQAAGEYFKEAYALAQRLDFHELDLVCLTNLASVQVEMGEFTQAEAGVREVIRRAESATSFLLAEAYRHLALACLGQGCREEALAMALRALDLARKSRMDEHIGKAWRVLGRITAAFETTPGSAPLMVEGRSCSAHTCYAASLQIFVEMGAAGEQARTALELASYELERGDRHEGARLWQDARDLFERLGLATEVERMDRMAAHRDEIG